MKKFKSVGSYIEESQRGRHLVFLVENDIERDEKLEALAYTDLIGKQVEIDEKVYTVKCMRNKKRSFASLDYKKGDIIGIEIL